jgi:hypothetical protein
MPPRLFKHAGFVAIVINAAVASMVYYSFTVLWPTIISSIYTTDSIQVGLQSSVVGGGILLGQIMGGMALGFLPGVKYQCIVASCLAISFITPLSALGPDTWEMTIALGVLGCIGVFLHFSVLLSSELAEYVLTIMQRWATSKTSPSPG